MIERADRSLRTTPRRRGRSPGPVDWASGLRRCWTAGCDRGHAVYEQVIARPSRAELASVARRRALVDHRRPRRRLAGYVEEDEEEEGQAASLQGEPRQAPEHGSLTDPCRGPRAARPARAISSTSCTARESPIPTGGSRTAMRPTCTVGGGPERTHPARRSMPAPTGAWHERLVALMQLPVVAGMQVRRDRGVRRWERPAGAEAARARPSGSAAIHQRPRGRCSTRPPGGRCGGGDRLVPPVAATARSWRSASPRAATRTASSACSTSPPAKHLDDEIPRHSRRSVAWLPGGSGVPLHPLPRGRRVRPQGLPPPARRRPGRRRARLGRAADAGDVARRARVARRPVRARHGHGRVGTYDVHLLDVADRQLAHGDRAASRR